MKDEKQPYPWKVAVVIAIISGVLGALLALVNG